MRKYLDELPNLKDLDIDFYSNAVGATKPATSVIYKPVATVQPSTTTASKPSTVSKPVSTTGLSAISPVYTRPLPVSTPTTTPTTSPTVVDSTTPYVAPAVISGGGGGGGGSMGAEPEQKSAEASTGGDAGVGKILGMDKITFYKTGSFLVLGAIAGFFTGRHLKKNKLLFTGIGAGIGAGISFVVPNTVFIKKPTVKSSSFSGEEKSNFTSTGGKYKEKKCWCAGTHGMVQCPCGGHHLSVSPTNPEARYNNSKLGIKISNNKTGFATDGTCPCSDPKIHAKECCNKAK